jgi:recombination associated protein RdgC
MAQERHVDFLELWQEKMFLGQEFLTWLWLSSEVDNKFAVPGGTEIEVWFENSIRLEIGQGQSRKSVTCQSSGQEDGSGWAEAFTAVWRNKKVSNARLRIRSDEREWALTLPSDTLSPKSVKLLAGADFKQAESGKAALAGALLDRTTFLVELANLLENLLGLFLGLRLSQAWETEELPRLKGWVARWAQEGQPGNP